MDLRVSIAVSKNAIFTFIFFALISISGVLLGLKKNTGLLVSTQKGVSLKLDTWLPIHSLAKRAAAIFRDSISRDMSADIDRIDIRPDKGVAKFLFKKGYWGVQIDGTSDALLSIEKRRSDFIEDIHDGSILDDLFGTSDEQIKYSYTTFMGLCLLLLVASGFWLWYGPKKVRQNKRSGQV